MDSSEDKLIDAGALERAISSAQRVLWTTQREDGSWDAPCDLGPVSTAQVVVALKFVGRLDATDAADAARKLVSLQRSDGSFGAHPFALKGDVCTTACAWAAFHSAGLADDAAPLRAARAFVEGNGGLDAVVAGLGTLDPSAYFVAMAGILDPQKLPELPMSWSLLPPLSDLVERRLNLGVVMMTLQLGVLSRYLRGAFGPQGDHQGFLTSLACVRCAELMHKLQNPNGSWNDITIMTALGLATLKALGHTQDESRFDRAVAWLSSRRIHDTDGMWYSGYASDVWSTALDARALLGSDVPPATPALAKALTWLADHQDKAPVPEGVAQRPDQAVARAWAFESDNPLLPDCDDAGIVMCALAPALMRVTVGSLPEDVAGRIGTATDRGNAWLRGMQNDDGGWSSYAHGLPGKAAGMLPNVDMSSGGLVGLLQFALDPPKLLGDPSTAGLTGRVLSGLSLRGATVKSPFVAKAVAFLEAQVADNGAWWGRWVVNYLASTAWVLTGLAGVGQDMRAPFVQRAVRFTLDHQNADGGWGETAESYVDVALAGVGPSMPPLTGLVLSGLLAAGEGGSEAVRRGVAYLLAQQRSDGSWANADWLHVFLEPKLFYHYPESPRFYPLHALGRYRAFLQGRSVVDSLPSALEPAEAILAAGPGPLPPSRADGGRWSDAFLETMRKVSDAPGDAVIRAIFADGAAGRISELMMTLARNDDPVPPGLPPVAVDYFERTAALPAWADPARIIVAQRLFSRCGWAVATSLFCCALPQTFASSSGARVLMYTHGMTTHTKRRIFETAQFIFDVMDEGALSPSARGIRTAQKVRLMHAAVRHLLLQDGRWDPAWAYPINQEDLAFTLMSFSCITLDALERLRITVSAEEGEAWVHAWNVVGHLLGVEDALLPRDRADGEALAQAYRRSQWGSSLQGKMLASSLVDTIRSFVPAASFQSVPAAFVRHLAGDHCADLLGLPPADWALTLDLTGRSITALTVENARHAGMAKVWQHAMGLIMKGVTLVEREGKENRFRIPTSLLRGWGEDD